MNTGIYIRVGKDNILLEQMEDDDREEWLSKFDNEGLKKVIKILCDTLCDIEIEFNLLEWDD